MSQRNCPDCANVSDDTWENAGQCSQCHGTGFLQGMVEVEPEDVAGESRPCRACDASGECSTCKGKGYVEYTGDSDSGLYKTEKLR